MKKGRKSQPAGLSGDTICALCTAKGKAALSLIRVSGPEALQITREIAPFLPLKPESHRAYFGLLKRKGAALDQAIAAYFAEGRSFTGEETLEISCHGGGIYSEILEALIESGARQAARGEFSFQAFSNGKMDLTQAEGLLRLIESESGAGRRQAFFQLEGALSEKLKILEKKWLLALSHLEADIDFSLEGLSLLDDRQIKELLEKLRLELKDMIARYQPFENLQKGLSFGIFGKANSGKSSLFNALLGEERAIVSKEEGATRDIVEGRILSPKGLNIQLKDSAGFRLSQSEAEIKGQEKSKSLFASCDYKIVTVDPLRLEEAEKSLFKDPEKSLLVFTKKDLAAKGADIQALSARLRKKIASLPPRDQVFFASSLTGEGISFLREKILSYGEIDQESFFISNYRHYKGLKTMERALGKSLEILKGGAERDLMALELREGLQALYEILGKQIDDKILDNIFKEFCIGK